MLKLTSADLINPQPRRFLFLSLRLRSTPRRSSSASIIALSDFNCNSILRQNWIMSLMNSPTRVCPIPYFLLTPPQYYSLNHTNTVTEINIMYHMLLCCVSCWSDRWRLVMLITWTGLALTTTTELLTKVFQQFLAYNQLGCKKKLNLFM